MVCCFFFKQKTAYELRISDWSSDVCSSDLLAVADPDALAAKVRNAGAIFLGRYTPEAIGDYLAGPNHVLPTARSARFSSGLSVLDFMKRTSLIACDAEALAAIGPAAVRLAPAGGLDAIGRASCRERVCQNV